MARFASGLAAEPDNLVLRAARLLAAKTGCERHRPIAAGKKPAGRQRHRRRVRRRRRQPAAPQAGMGERCPLGRSRSRAGRGCAGLPGPVQRQDGRHWRNNFTPAPELPEFGICLDQPRYPRADRRCLPRNRPPEFSPPASLPAAWPDAAAMAAALAKLQNDLEATAIALAPPIEAVTWQALRQTRRCLFRPDERLRRHLLRLVQHTGRSRFGRRPVQVDAARLVVLGRGALRAWGCRPMTTPACPPGLASLIGTSPSGKAADFDSAIRRFDPSRPSQFSHLTSG